MTRAMRRAGMLLSSAAALLVASPGFACSVCNCGDPLPQAGESGLRTGALRLRLEGEALSGDARMDDGSTMDLAQQTLRPVVVFSPLERLHLVAQLPIVRKDVTMTMIDATDPHASTGLGDLDLGARYFVWSHASPGSGTRHELALTFGTSLPTGQNEATMDGMRLDEHAQPGTGAFGPYLGAFYALERQELTVAASATGRARTMNGHGYRYGAAALFGVSAEQRLSGRFTVGLGLDGRWAAKDSAAGLREENTGGFLLSLTPLLGFSMNPQLSLQLRAQLPVARQLNGVQHVGPVFTLAVEYAAGL